MTAKELIDKLSEVAPDTETVGGMWNGRVDTYTVMDKLHVFQYDQIYADFYGTPRAFDDKMQHILRMHRSREWKKEQIYKLLQEFDKNTWSQGDK